jgi:hypothetical protein
MTQYGGQSSRWEPDRKVTEALAATLNSLDTRQSEHACWGIEGADDSEIQLLLGYADGPPAGP